VLMAALATPFERPLARADQPSMPAIVFMRPLAEGPSLVSTSRERSPKATARPPAAAAAGTPPATPVEAPSDIAAEADATSGADGLEGGVPGGIVGGVVDGPVSAGVSSSGPLRLMGSLRPPRKIKDVKPVYPQSALAGQARGSVIIDVTIGIDGKVHEAKVLNSVPLLDSAALDAVRQWEYEPTVLNGVLVALIMTVVVNFTIQ